MSEYQPFSWNGQPITDAKLNQMVQNTQYIFERSPQIRYAANGVTRDTAVKILVGKTPIPPSAASNKILQQVNFGSYFTAGCQPIVTATYESYGGGSQRARVTIAGLSTRLVIDHIGFWAVVSQEDLPRRTENGFVHWQAVGY